MVLIDILRTKLFKRKLSIQICLLVCLFGTGSWIAVNGIWVELPIIVHYAPEGWSLPSYLAVIIQVANIGPLVYGIGNKMAPKVFKEVPVIHCIVTVSALALLLLPFLWKETTYIAGAKHSTALIALAFFVALVDCTSSVTFLPFMAKFPKDYMTFFFIGEGLSTMLPSWVALIQGVGTESVYCPDLVTNALESHLITNMTTEPNNSLVTYTNANFSGLQTNITKLINLTNTSKNVSPDNIYVSKTAPSFSPKAFFIFLFAFMVICEISFLGLNYLPAAKQEHLLAKAESVKRSKHHEEHIPLETTSQSAVRKKRSSTQETDHAFFISENNSSSSLVSNDTSVYQKTVEETSKSPSLSMRQVLFMLCLLVFVEYAL